MSINIDYTLEFKRNIRQLVKKSPSIRQDIEPIIQGLQQGELLGDRIQHSGYVFISSESETVITGKVKVRAIGSFIM